MCFSFAEDMPGDFTQKYRIMCRNGTKVDFTSNLDDECFLTVVTGGEVCCIFTWYKVYSLHSMCQTVVMINGVTTGKLFFMTF
jgi:hypothetical protein